MNAKMKMKPIQPSKLARKKTKTKKHSFKKEKKNAELLSISRARQYAPKKSKVYLHTGRNRARGVKNR